MFRWLYILPYLFDEVIAARRDARIRFLNAQVEILRRKLGCNRVIPSPDDRARLLAIGSKFNHDVDGVIGIGTQQTYSRWVVDQREGRKPHQVGRPKVARNIGLISDTQAFRNRNLRDRTGERRQFQPSLTDQREFVERLIFCQQKKPNATLSQWAQFE